MTALYNSNYSSSIRIWPKKEFQLFLFSQTAISPHSVQPYLQHQHLIDIPHTNHVIGKSCIL